MVPIFARYGELFVYSFTITLAIGVLAGIGLTAWREGKDSLWLWFDALLATILGAVIGGRAGFVLFNWQYYQERTNEIVQFSQGGYNYYFALGGGILFFYIWVSSKGYSFYQIFAMLAPAFVLFTVFGWAACWLEGCAYGKTTFISPLSAELPDDFGVFAVRYQSQLIGLLLSALLFLMILTIADKTQSRHLFWLTIGSVSLVHLITTIFRGDPNPMWVNLRLDTWIDLLLIIVSIVMLILFQFRRRTAIELA